MRAAIYKIRISLIGSKPLIWRRVLIEDDTTMYDFHKIIQSSMGWTNSHLHQFTADGGKSYTKFYADLEDDFAENEFLYYEGMVVSDFMKTPGDCVVYEYDFGDGWEHVLLLESVEEPKPYLRYPVCIDGKRNCPPEDVGGLDGFYRMLRIQKKPTHPQYRSYLMWLGGKFNTDELDLFKVNKLLARKDLGVSE
jgi:hypothetical protein